MSSRDKELDSIHRRAKALLKDIYEIGLNPRSFALLARTYNELYRRLRKVIGDKPQLAFREYPQRSPDLLYPDKVYSYYYGLKHFAGQLIAYTESEMNYADRVVIDLVGQIENKLRPMMKMRPKSETEVQDELEKLLRNIGYEFDREKFSFRYSAKSYKPDFTSDKLSTVLEVKLCDEYVDEKRMVKELNDDIPAYGTQFKRMIFVVYDSEGVIRDKDSFKKDFEKNPGVHVIVIKH